MLSQFYELENFEKLVENNRFYYVEMKREESVANNSFSLKELQIILRHIKKSLKEQKNAEMYFILNSEKNSKKIVLVINEMQKFRYFLKE